MLECLAKSIIAYTEFRNDLLNTFRMFLLLGLLLF